MCYYFLCVARSVSGSVCDCNVNDVCEARSVKAWVSLTGGSHLSFVDLKKLKSNERN